MRTKDWRLQYVTITDCKVTGDLHDATVYYTVRGVTLDEEPDVDGAGGGTKSRRGQLRKIMGDQLGVRYTPTLSFSLDTVPEASAHMEELLARARARDEELAELAKNAQPAGDANPYRTTDISEDDTTVSEE